MSGIANQLSNWMLLLFVVGIPLYAAIKKLMCLMLLLSVLSKDLIRF